MQDQPTVQEGSPPDDGPVRRTCTAMDDAYFARRGLVAAGRLCEVGFDDLRRDPVGAVGSIYDKLGLPGFADLRPRPDGSLASVAGFRQNRHDGPPGAPRRRIVAEWGRGFAEWGYEP